MRRILALEWLRQSANAACQCESRWASLFSTAKNIVTADGLPWTGGSRAGELFNPQYEEIHIPLTGCTTRSVWSLECLLSFTRCFLSSDFRFTRTVLRQHSLRIPHYYKHGISMEYGCPMKHREAPLKHRLNCRSATQSFRPLPLLPPLHTAKGPAGSPSLIKLNLLRAFH